MKLVSDLETFCYASCMLDLSNDLDYSSLSRKPSPKETNAFLKHYKHAMFLDKTASDRLVTKEDLVKLFNFSRINNLELLVDNGEKAYPGVLFSEGGAGYIQESLMLSATQEIGHYRYVNINQYATVSYVWSYVRIKLALDLPHLIFAPHHSETDFSAGGAFSDSSGINVRQSKNQKVKLEGDFNNYFTLYAPDGYEVDVRYLITPDVMAVLVDYGSEYNIEVVDDSIVFFTAKPINFQYELELKKAITNVDKVAREFIEQSRLYKDYRTTSGLQEKPENAQKKPSTISQEGRRLKSKNSAWVALIVVGIIYISSWVILFYVFPPYQ